SSTYPETAPAFAKYPPTASGGVVYFPAASVVTAASGLPFASCAVTVALATGTPVTASVTVPWNCPVVVTTLIFTVLVATANSDRSVGVKVTDNVCPFPGGRIVPAGGL